MKFKEICKFKELIILVLFEISGVFKCIIEDIECKGECKVFIVIKLVDVLKVIFDKLCR